MAWPPPRLSGRLRSSGSPRGRARLSASGGAARNRFELVEGDVRHLDTCRRACEGVEIVFHKADVAAARRLFGYEPEVSFEAGLRQTIDWYRWALETGYGGWAEKTG